MIFKHDVVQFAEQHKWCGCLGIVTEVRPEKIMVSVQIPEQGTAYIFCTKDDLERIGRAVLVPNEEDENE